MNKDMANIYRPTWARIDLGNLAFNYRRIKQTAGKKVNVLAAVKADAYGHGMIEAAKVLAACGTDYFGVASVDEALYLRAHKIKIPVLVMGAVFSFREIILAAKNDITLSIVDMRSALAVNRCRSAKKIRVHLKIDTGMGRLGIWHEQAFESVKRICALKNLITEGIYTHFPSADCDLKFTLKQISVFEALISRLKDTGINFRFMHAANSIAACRLNARCFDFLNMVRPGIMLYGMYPDKRSGKYVKLRPVLSLMTKISYLKDVPSGRTISYGRTYTTKKNTRIATLPIGYADGYCRALSNKAYVLINGKRFPVVGRVCMDQTMVDVGADKDIRLGNRVVLIGKDRTASITAEEIADICRTIPYEITCGISSRVRRVFKKY